MSLFKVLGKLLSGGKKYQTQRRKQKSNHERGHKPDGKIASKESFNRTSPNFRDIIGEFEQMTVVELVKTIQNQEDIRRLERAQEAVENRMTEDIPQSELNRLERIRDKFENAWERAFDKTIAYHLDPESVRWNDPVAIISIAGRNISIEEFNKLKKKFPEWRKEFYPITLNDYDDETGFVSENVVQGCIQLQSLRNEGAGIFLKQADKIIGENQKLAEFLEKQSSGASARCLLEDELCELPAVGVERARFLFENGVHSLDDVLEGRLDDVDIPGIGEKTRVKIHHWIVHEKKRRKNQM